jgi:ankyrin repeat protein
MRACETGQLANVEVLCESGASVNAVDKGGWSPLMYAASCGFADIVQVLLHRGAIPNLQSKVRACLPPARLHCCYLPHPLGGAVPRRARVRQIGWTAVMYAASEGHDNVLGVLLRAGAATVRPLPLCTCRSSCRRGPLCLSLCVLSIAAGVSVFHCMRL